MSNRVILIVESNPKDTLRLKLNNEKRAIRDALRNTGAEQLFTVHTENASRIDDLGDALVRYKPEIVHFMGHGEGEAGLCFEGEDGKKQLLANNVIDSIFKLASQSVKFVFLNACYSEIQAKIIIKHIDHVVGMNDKIPDITALKFAEQFYHYIGLKETSPIAFNWARTMIEAHALPSHLVPVLLTKTDHSESEGKPKPETHQPASDSQPPETLTPNSPLLVIPTSPEYKLLADKHYREVEAEFEGRWGIVNSRRASSVSVLKRELDMDMPNVVYVYTKIESGKLLLDVDKHGNSFDLESLATWFKRSGLRPLLILVLFGRIDETMIPDSLREQTRFIWCLYSPLDTALDDLSNTVRLFFERTSQAGSDDLKQLITGLKPRMIIRSECFEHHPLQLRIDAKAQRAEQQFRAALLRIMLGREEIKTSLGRAIQKHLGKQSVFVYAVIGSSLSCVFELPQQVYYEMLPNSVNEQGVVLVNWPLHININPTTCDDDWNLRASIDEVIRYNIKHGSPDLTALIEQKASSMGINANTGAIVFHWNATVDEPLSETQLNKWLTIWSEMIAEDFGELYAPGATLVHALCFKVKDRPQIEGIHKQIQRFIKDEIRQVQSLTPYSVRKPLSNLEPDEIEDFFNHEDNQRWVEYFRFNDFNIDRIDLSEWVCDKTNGEFEEVVRVLWQTQQINYREYLQDTMV